MTEELCKLVAESVRRARTTLSDAPFAERIADRVVRDLIAAGLIIEPGGVSCDMTCTVDCGRCKGRPLDDLKRRIRRALWDGRDSHGGVPFATKDVWRQGFDAARRSVLEAVRW